jgi:hypothetical protein
VIGKTYTLSETPAAIRPRAETSGESDDGSELVEFETHLAR